MERAKEGKGTEEEGKGTQREKRGDGNRIDAGVCIIDFRGTQIQTAPTHLRKM